MDPEYYSESDEYKPSKLMTILSWILRAPLIILVLFSWLISFYAAYAKLQGVTYTVPIVYTILVILYVIGTFMKVYK